MDGSESTASGLDAVAQTVGEHATEAIKTLANETRLAILLTLWDAQDRSGLISENEDVPLSFTELRKAVGMRDSGQFNYHLKQLTGLFVKQSEGGFTLTPPAERMLHTILAGTLTDAPSFDGEPVDVDCPRCGAPTVVDYDAGTLTWYCTSCEGGLQTPTSPPGTLTVNYFPPTGLKNRTPQEFFRARNTWHRPRWMSMVEGVCPDCSGPRTATLHVCEAHDTTDGGVCPNCGLDRNPQWAFVCDVCKLDSQMPASFAIFTDSGVQAFFYEHGRDYNALSNAGAFAELVDPRVIENVEVIAEDPPELRVTVELEGDTLTVTLDADATVVKLSASKN